LRDQSFDGVSSIRLQPFLPQRFGLAGFTCGG